MKIDLEQSQINNLYSKFNFDEVCYAKNSLYETTNNTNIKTDEFTKKNKLNKQKTITLIISLIGAITLTILSLRKISQINTLQKPVENLSVLNFENVEQLMSKTNDSDRSIIDEIISTFKENSRRIFKNNENISNFDKLEQLMAIEKSKIYIQDCDVPDLIFLKNVNEEVIDDVGQILAGCFECNFKKYTYIKEKMSEFLKYFSEFAETSSKYENRKIRTFFSIENFSDFIDDINQKANEDRKKIFLSFIQNCSSNNKVSLIINNDYQDKLSNFNSRAIILDFNKINSDNIKNSSENSKIFNSFKKIKPANDFKINPTNPNFDIWWSDYMYEPKKENIILTGLNKKIKKFFLDEFCEKTGLPIETIDLKEKSVEELFKSAKKHETKYQITGEERLLYIKNIQDFIAKNDEGSLEFVKLKEFLKSSHDKYGIQSIYDADRICELPRNFLNFDCGYIELKFRDSFAYYEKIEKEIKKLNLEVLNDADEFTEQKKEIIMNFFKFIGVENRGDKINVPNGIMIYGDNQEKVDRLTDWIETRNIVQVKNFIFDLKNASDSIAKMYDSAKMAENLYQISGKRTLLHIKNLDELLTNQDTIKDRIRIGKFKSFIEYVSKKYHTTILMETTKPLDAFEEASIGDQRFNIKIKV